MPNLSESGVYIIQNLITGRVYVGSSLHMRKRWRDHKSELRRQKHHSPYLQRSWNKHGEAAFAFMVIEFCSNKEQREQYWLDVLQPFGSRGYNCYPWACGAPMVKEDVREKLRKAAMKPERLANSRAQFAKLNNNITQEQRDWRRQHMLKLNAKKTPEQMSAHQSAASSARWAKERVCQI